MEKAINQKVKESLDIYYDNIIDFAKQYQRGGKFEKTISYANGFKPLVLLLKIKYERKYDIKYDFMQGRAITVEPKMFIKSNNNDKNTAKDGIYIYIVFSTTEKSLNLSLEIGQDVRYTNKRNVFLENIKKFQNKYESKLNLLKDNLMSVGTFKILTDADCIFKIETKDVYNIAVYIDTFATIYDEIINDIKKYQLEDNIWGQNWEQFQKDIFQGTYLNSLNGVKNEGKSNDQSNIGDENMGAYNCIYYGIPGCGKSYYIKEKYHLDEDYTRTTFHPDYTNSDFVGQIIPKIDEVDDSKIVYDFEPGPFTVALYNALKNKKKKYYLVIEEINRGNASAIFGDIFQILDRNENGKSRYLIDNYAITKYLKSKGIDEIEKVYLPSNLWIIATMNTSDQNVYTLDTAFKRRWEMRYVPNEFKDKEYDRELKSMFIPYKDSNVTWEVFVNCMNKAILNNNIGGLNGEDKQIGVYFVNKKELLFKSELEDSILINQKKKAFGEKVLLYIWEDIVKNNSPLWFKKGYKSFAELLKDFNERGLDVFEIEFVGMN